MVPARSRSAGTGRASPSSSRNPSEPNECVVADYFTNSGSIQSRRRSWGEEYNRASIRSQLSPDRVRAFRCRLCSFSNSGKKATGCETGGLVDRSTGGLSRRSLHYRGAATHSSGARIARLMRPSFRQADSERSDRCGLRRATGAGSPPGQPARRQLARYRRASCRVRRRRWARHRSAAPG